jgi:hypothetical protein
MVVPDKMGCMHLFPSFPPSPTLFLQLADFLSGLTTSEKMVRDLQCLAASISRIWVFQ